MGHDLVQRSDVKGEEYFLGRDNTVMMYSAAQTTSDLPIKKIEWTYDSVTWEGWTFFPYLSESKGEAIDITSATSLSGANLVINTITI